MVQYLLHKYTNEYWRCWTRRCAAAVITNDNYTTRTAVSFHCHLSAHAQFTSPHPTFFLFRDALVKQQTITYITMNGINIVAPPVTSKRRQRLFPAWDTFIGVDLAGLLGGRMASAEGGSVRSGVGYGEGCPLSSRLRGLGERRTWAPPAGSGAEPRPKTDFGVFWRPQNAYFCTYDKIWGGDNLH